MANCTEFQNLTPRERADYLGELIHSCQSDSVLYELGKKIIRQAKKKGLFEGVVIQPENWSPVPPDETVNNI